MADPTVIAGSDCYYRPFFERELSVEYVEGKKLWGVVDFFVASGNYIIGRHWYFVLLDGLVCAESLAYDETKDEIMAIVGILRQAKDIIDGPIQRFHR